MDKWRFFLVYIYVLGLENLDCSGYLNIFIYWRKKKRMVKNGILYFYYIIIIYIGWSKFFVICGCCVFVLFCYCCLKFVLFCINVWRNIVISCSRKIVDLVFKLLLMFVIVYFFFIVEVSYLFSDFELGSEV